MSQIRLLITDFDGTLVDTFEANFMAYQKAFENFGLCLSEKQYRACFGLRFDDFMQTMGVSDDSVKQGIKNAKGEFYPQFFNKLKVNQSLLSMLRNFKQAGGFTAVASTARKKNLMNALCYIGAKDIFTLVIAGEDVKHGKPDPEIYNSVLDKMNVLPSEALVFEDSTVGIEAAQAAGLSYIKITNEYFYGNTSKGA